MAEKKPFPWAVVLGVGCLVILCIVIVGVVLVLAFFIPLRRETQTATQPEVVFATEATVPMPLDTPLPTVTTQATAAATVTQAVQPTNAAPTDTGLGLTGQQQVSENAIYDDFSSDALGWPVYDDGMTVLRYEDQAYLFQITQPEYYDWAYFPVDFIPHEISFDVRGPEGEQNGTFGLFCHFQDADNYYYVEFDLETNEYVIGQIRDAEYIPLTQEDENGQFWHFSSALNSPPTATNRISVSCYLDSITLTINNEMVDQVSVTQPFSQTGDAAFFVYAFDFADENGYKVYFDNVEAYQPVQ